VIGISISVGNLALHSGLNIDNWAHVGVHSAAVCRAACSELGSPADCSLPACGWQSPWWLGFWYCSVLSDEVRGVKGRLANRRRREFFTIAINSFRSLSFRFDE